MDPIELTIPSSTNPCRILVGRGLLPRVHKLIASALALPHLPHIAVITDSQVASLHAQPVVDSLTAGGAKTTLLTVPAGETSKTLAEAGRLAEAMIAAGLDRRGLVLALGGGVVGDLAGFVASIFQRGIPVVQVPTTVIAQVDSAIGGKTGVNVPSGKNLLGTFHPPELVIVDVDVLGTLPEREFNAGFAEIIKHAVIRDRGLFDRLFDFDRATIADAMLPIVRRNLEIKAAIVAEDEFERAGLRALLNFGHTVGHGIEQAAGYGRFLHGEAVAIGLVAAGRLSIEFAGFPEQEFARLVALMRRFKLPVALPADVSTDAVMTSLAHDKKFESGNVRYVLTPGIGSAILSKAITVADIRRTVDGLRNEP